jgi:uncharacterized membrane protein
LQLRLRDILALTTVAYLVSVAHKLLFPRILFFPTDIGYVYFLFVLPTNNGIPYHAYSALSHPGYVYPAIPSILTWLSGFAPDPLTFFATMAFLTFPFVLGGAYFLYRICTEFGFDRGRMLPFFIMAPSFLILSFYSWDIIAASFVIIAIYFVFKKRPRLTGLCIGLGFAAKAYPLLLLPVFLKEAESWRGRLELFLSAALGALLPNLPFMIIDFHGWFSTVAWPSGAEPGGTGGFYLENSIWVIIRYYHLISQDWLMGAIVWSLIALGILYVTFSSYPFVKKLWLVVAITILIFPIYPPQFNVWLLPLFVLNPLPLIPFLVFDFLDTAIILSWFTVDDPRQPWGPVWIIFVIRIVVLALILTWAALKRNDQPPHSRVESVLPDPTAATT